MELIGSGIDLQLIKGAQLVSALDPSLPPYCSGDIDLLYREEDTKLIKSLLNDLGYTQALFPGSGVLRPVPSDHIEQFEIRQFELFPFLKLVRLPSLNPLHEFISGHLPSSRFFIRNRQVFFTLIIDLHKTLFPGMSAEALWVRRQPLSFRGNQVDILGDSDLAWWWGSRFYTDLMVLDETSAKALPALVILLNRGRVDFELVAELGKREAGMFGSLFYVFSFLKHFVGLDVPQEFLDDVYPKRFTSSQHVYDFGDFLPRLFRQRILFRPVPSTRR